MDSFLSGMNQKGGQITDSSCMFVHLFILNTGSVWSLDGSKSICEKLFTDLASAEIENERNETGYSNLTSITYRVFPMFNKNACFEAASMGRRLGEWLSKMGATEILLEVRNGN